MEDLERLRLSPLHTALGRGTQSEHTGVIQLLLKLSEGEVITKKDQQGYSDYFNMVLKLAENFLSFDVAPDGPDVKGKPIKTLIGRRALVWKFDEVKEAFKEKKPVDVEGLESLRVFGWMLDQMQKSQVDAWIKTSLNDKMMSKHYSGLKIKDGPPGPPPISDSSSSSTALVVPKPSFISTCKAAAASKTPFGSPPVKKTKEKETDYGDVSLHKFFIGKKKKMSAAP